MDLKINILNQIAQTKKDKCSLFSFTCRYYLWIIRYVFEIQISLEVKISVREHGRVSREEGKNMDTIRRDRVMCNNRP